MGARVGRPCTPAARSMSALGRAYLCSLMIYSDLITPMTNSTATIDSLRELEHRLNQCLPGQAHFDALTRVLYSTDASIHQIEPLGVVYPHQADDLCAA